MVAEINTYVHDDTMIDSVTGDGNLPAIDRLLQEVRAIYQSIGKALET